jgi:hypothetical protein
MHFSEKSCEPGAARSVPGLASTHCGFANFCLQAVAVGFSTGARTDLDGRGTDWALSNFPGWRPLPRSSLRRSCKSWDRASHQFHFLSRPFFRQNPGIELVNFGFLFAACDVRRVAHAKAHAFRVRFDFWLHSHRLVLAAKSPWESFENGSSHVPGRCAWRGICQWRARALLRERFGRAANPVGPPRPLFSSAAIPLRPVS